MVVGEDDAGGVGQEGHLEERAGLDGGPVEGAEVGDLPGDEAVAGVEVYGAHGLLGPVVKLAVEELGDGLGVGERDVLVGRVLFADEGETVAGDDVRLVCFGRLLDPLGLQ